MTVVYYGVSTPPVTPVMYGVGVEPQIPWPGREWFPPAQPIPLKPPPIDEGHPECGSIADEIRVMSECYQRVKKLGRDEQLRVLAWVQSRLESDFAESLRADK
jgi:hypothetical protein